MKKALMIFVYGPLAFLEKGELYLCGFENGEQHARQVLHGGHWRQSAFQSYLIPVVVHFTNIYAVKISAKNSAVSK